MENPENTEQFKRSLTLFDGIMLVVGSMIGSGIFIVSADITRQVGATGWLLLIWLMTGVVTIMAAVSYAELSAMFPKAGGQYVYLKEAYNKLVAFLYGWSFFAVIQTGTIAAVGVAFAKFTAYLFPSLAESHLLFEVFGISINMAQVIAVMSILLLTYLNSLGVKSGKWIQVLFTATKIIALAALVIFGVVISFETDVLSLNFEHFWEARQYHLDTHQWVNISGLSLVGAVIGAMVGSLFSSDAWNGVTFIAAELKNPERNVGMSLFLGTLLVTVLYLATNVMYVMVLPLDAIAQAPFDRVGIAVATTIFGQTGTYFIAILIMISTFGCNNGLILAGARVYYTMANDDLFFAKAKKLNTHQVPGWGLWMQAIWASFLCFTGQYGALLDFVILVVLLFYILTIYGIFILRKKMPDVHRPYKAFGYPWMPALYIVCAGIICISLLITKTATCGWGLLIVLLGVPLYYLQKKKGV